jgi:hypothetical protein
VGGKLISRFADNLAAELARVDSGTETADDDSPAGSPADVSAPADAGAATEAGSDAATRAAAEEARRPTGSPAGAASDSPAARPSAEAVDLLEFAGPSIAKRAVPLLGGLALLWTLRRLFRRSRRRT